VPIPAGWVKSTELLDRHGFVGFRRNFSITVGNRGAHRLCAQG
jgi:hypothetical protein